VAGLVVGTRFRTRGTPSCDAVICHMCTGDGEPELWEQGDAGVRVIFGVKRDFGVVMSSLL